MSSDSVHRARLRARLTASLALAAAAPLFAVPAVLVARGHPHGLAVLGCGVLLATAVWEAMLRRGWARGAGFSIAGLAGVAQVLMAHEALFPTVLAAAVGGVALYCGATAAFGCQIPLPPVDRPQRPVVVINPTSGDGRAARHHLASEARRRGIRPVELGDGDDLGALVRRCLDEGADGLAMAGGDGSQAVVAAAAAERGLPYACIPAGTRNHFALDLGVDREDVVGALDAFVDGGERVVDLAEVNGRVFVNNVSVGLYAEAVRRSGYRAAKLRTLFEASPGLLTTAGPLHDLRWVAPDGTTVSGAAVMLVANNAYRLFGAGGVGTRPSMSRGMLGVVVIVPRRAGRARWGGPIRQWTATDLRIESGRAIAVGIDGESTILAPPLQVRSRPRALRVRVARHHPGASPSALQPAGTIGAIRALALMSLGKWPTTEPPVGAALHRTGVGPLGPSPRANDRGPMAEPTLTTAIPEPPVRSYDIDLVGPDDRAALQDLFNRSTVETRYHRFHYMVSTFPHRHLEDLTCTGCPHLALAARRRNGTRAGEMIGLASAAISGSEAEIAVWIADDWQRQGVGSALAAALVERLAAAGVRILTAVVSFDNAAARGLVRRLAPEAASRHLDANTVEFRMPISPAADQSGPGLGVPAPRPADPAIPRTARQAH